IQPYAKPGDHHVVSSRSHQEKRRDRRKHFERSRKVSLSLESLEARQLLSAVLPSTSPRSLLTAIAPAARAQTHSPQASVFTVPGRADQLVAVTFTHAGRSADYRDEVGLIQVDDSAGRLGNLKPRHKSYAAVALASPTLRVVLGQDQKRGATTILELQGGSKFILYLVQNKTSTQLLSRNPTGNPFRR